MKSSRGLGFTIVSADDSDVELLQIKTILPNGSADIDGRLQRGQLPWTPGGGGTLPWEWWGSATVCLSSDYLTAAPAFGACLSCSHSD